MYFDPKYSSPHSVGVKGAAGSSYGPVRDPEIRLMVSLELNSVTLLLLA
jgi:hypothetical protein